MNSTDPLICMGYPPQPEKDKKNGFLSLPSFFKILLFIIVFFLSFQVPPLIHNEYLPFGSQNRELAIQEILEVLEEKSTGLTYVTNEELAGVIYEEAIRYNQDPKFILAVIAIESSFQNWSVSSQGAKGLMQIMPYVAESLAQNVGIEWNGDHILFNPFFNIRIGIYYLSKLIQDFDDLGLALEAYNYGPTYIKGRLEKRQKISGKFYNKILNEYRNL